MSFGFSFLFVCIGGVRSGGGESKPRGAAVGFDFTLVGSIPTLSCAGRVKPPVAKGVYLIKGRNDWDPEGDNQPRSYLKAGRLIAVCTGAMGAFLFYS